MNFLSTAAVLLRASDPAAAAVRQPPGTRAVALRWPVPLRLALQDRTLQGELQAMPDGRSRVRLGEVEHVVDLRAARPGEAQLVMDGVDICAAWRREGDTLHLHWAGRAWALRDLARAPAERAGGSGSGQVRATMAGRVVALRVAVGDTVAAGAPLVVLEAMKMEHVHVAPIAGRITALAVTMGEQLAAQRLLAEVAPG